MKLAANRAQGWYHNVKVDEATTVSVVGHFDYDGSYN